MVGANPLKAASLASKNAFVVVQDLFMTETAKQADIVLPAASAYEKNGTVTNVCGEVQRLKQAIKVMGTKTDLEIFGLIAKEMGLNLGIWLPDKVFEEIRKTRARLRTSAAVLAIGGAVPTLPLNGRVAALPGTIQSAGDTLFTSGTLSPIFEDTEYGHGISWRNFTAEAGAIVEDEFLIIVSHHQGRCSGVRPVDAWPTCNGSSARCWLTSSCASARAAWVRMDCCSPGGRDQADHQGRHDSFPRQ